MEFFLQLIIEFHKFLNLLRDGLYYYLSLSFFFFPPISCHVIIFFRHQIPFKMVVREVLYKML